MHLAAAAVVFFSILFPAKGWFAPNQPVSVQVKADQDLTLVLTDFPGTVIEPKEGMDASVSKGQEKPVDISALFPSVRVPGTYLLYAVPKGAKLPKFAGTPLVINVLEDHRRGAQTGAMVTHVEPLRYATMKTEQGTMTLAFYYDAAPHTVDNFLNLAEHGFYDGLTFHRIVPGFVIQGGDPRGTGTGGPGYQITAEFNDRPHLAGVLSMARNGDPLEQQPPYPLPRAEFANTAGSQFFICLDYAQTKALDKKYTAFGKVVEGMDAVEKIAKSPLADPATGRPAKPPVMQEVKVLAVTADKNPYANLKEHPEADAEK
jgi:peptidyl-prolyl cis-trans isomerase B (cyclophilin B)